ncbi:MAG: hypothetical protein V1888_03875 [archaeon]
MGVKEVRELENGIQEVSVSGAVKNSEDWIKKDFVSEDDFEVEEVEEKGFLIGNSLLGRDEEHEEWRAESLEDSVDWEEAESFGDDFESGGFSYDTSAGGNFYGASVGVGDLYGGEKSSSVDLYGTVVNRNSANLYGIGGSGKKSDGMTYGIGKPVAKKKGRGKKSGLEGGVLGKRKEFL